MTFIVIYLEMDSFMQVNLKLRDVTTTNILKRKIFLIDHLIYIRNKPY